MKVSHAARKYPPIFVIGTQRSGTTLLRLMLASHRDICIPPESMFFVRLEKKYGDALDLSSQVEAFMSDLYADYKFREWNVEERLLRQNLSRDGLLSYSEAVSIVYETFRQQFDPAARIWGDKNPDYVFSVDTVLRHFPNARIIHIIRDVRAVYNSVNAVAMLDHGPPLRHQMRLVTSRWSQVVSIEDKYKQDRRLYSVRYEDLVSSPRQTLAGICSWLCLDFDAHMLRFHEEGANRHLVPARALRVHQMTLQPVASERANAWMDELSMSDIEALEFLNLRNMRELGYVRITGRWRYRGLIRILPQYVESRIDLSRVHVHRLLSKACKRLGSWFSRT